MTYTRQHPPARVAGTHHTREGKACHLVCEADVSSSVEATGAYREADIRMTTPMRAPR